MLSANRGRKYSIISSYQVKWDEDDCLLWGASHKRYSFATHLLESGTDLMYIQELSGHKNSEKTEICTHVSTKSIGKIKSPLDNLNLKQRG
ncbi:MAG: tyrosine-type recombinase/integrase [Actinobacteria bacterium]|nr:tyrosine-type recombinase/integrase [Actinomycetota bacterium]MBU4450782.1 tyrosine-type recombinase/integrase [Actinomycetota bacterium]